MAIRHVVLSERADQLDRYYQTIQRYLPANYEAHDPAQSADGRCWVVVTGEDEAGWTMDDYVVPRLASGLHWVSDQPWRHPNAHTPDGQCADPVMFGCPADPH